MPPTSIVAMVQELPFQCRIFGFNETNDSGRIQKSFGPLPQTRMSPSLVPLATSLHVLPAQ